MKTLYPARVSGTNLAHLARTEARKDDEHALFAICPAGPGITRELELIPSEDEAKIVWCPDCASYKAAVAPRETLGVDERAGRLALRDQLQAAVQRGNENPSPAAPAWMLEQEG